MSKTRGGLLSLSSHCWMRQSGDWERGEPLTETIVEDVRCVKIRRYVWGGVVDRGNGGTFRVLKSRFNSTNQHKNAADRSIGLGVMLRYCRHFIIYPWMREADFRSRSITEAYTARGFRNVTLADNPFELGLKRTDMCVFKG